MPFENLSSRSCGNHSCIDVLNVLNPSANVRKSHLLETNFVALFEISTNLLVHELVRVVCLTDRWSSLQQ